MLVGITGGTGFVGNALLFRHLAQGDKVRLLSRRPSVSGALPGPVQFFSGDLTGPAESLKHFVDGVDVLYHCAGEIKDQTKMAPVHVKGTENLCHAANGRIKHWVQLSSVGAYGQYHDGVITEETSLNPAGIYEKTKAESDRLVINAAQKGAFTYSILRPSNILGPTMRNQSLFQMIAMINKGFFFFIGEPGASANYVHVNNVVEGLILCGKIPMAKGRIYNLSDYRSIEEFVVVIANALNKHVPKVRFPEPLVRSISRQCSWFPGFPLTGKRIDALTNRSRYPIKKIQDELGYVHQVSMEEGLRQMVMQKKESK